MRQRQIRSYFTLLALSMVLIPAVPVQAATFSFSQSGFAGSGRLFGTFVAPNFSPERSIDRDDLTEFSLTWSGNSVIPAFTTTLTDLLASQTSYFCFGNTCTSGVPTSLGVLNVVTNNDLDQLTRPRRIGIGGAQYSDFSVATPISVVYDFSVPGYTGLPGSPGVFLSTAPVEMRQVSTEAVPEPATIGGIALAAAGIVGRRLQRRSSRRTQVR
jgi:hypothetical protein